MRRIVFLILLGAVLFSGPSTAHAQSLPEVPVKGMITMVDIGGDSCTPCKMMVPIVRKIEEQYRGRAAIVSIDVGTDRNRLKLFNARVIPTQIFYDREGKETSRHEGFLDSKSIIEILEKMGAGQ